MDYPTGPGWGFLERRNLYFAFLPYCRYVCLDGELFPNLSYSQREGEGWMNQSQHSQQVGEAGRTPGKAIMGEQGGIYKECHWEHLSVPVSDFGGWKENLRHDSPYHTGMPGPLLRACVEGCTQQDSCRSKPGDQI